MCTCPQSNCRVGPYDFDAPCHPANEPPTVSQPSEPASLEVINENRRDFERLMARRHSMSRLLQRDIESIEDARLWALAFGSPTKRYS